MLKLSASLLAGMAAAVIASGAAQADVVISKKATANISCSAGVCSPTAAKAVLNATDLANMLASGDVTVTTGAGATNIVVKDSFSWTSTRRLTLDAIQSVEFDKPVTVADTGAVTITTNDGGSGGDLSFGDKGNLTFWDLSSSLIVNGSSYTLVGDIKTLAADIAANPSGSYALGNDYNAKNDKLHQAPIRTSFSGTFEGIGHAISNLAITNSRQSAGLFAQIFGGTVRNLALPNVLISGAAVEAGALVGDDRYASIQRCYATGAISLTSRSDVGGLIGVSTSDSFGEIQRSGAAVDITAPDAYAAGGLAGFLNSAAIKQSYATGAVTGGDKTRVGGLVGAMVLQSYVQDSYATGAVNGGASAHIGGLVGDLDFSGAGTSYSMGEITGGKAPGGFIARASDSGFVDNYWDSDTSGQEVHRGYGGCHDHDTHRECRKDIIGLTSSQFTSKLPLGLSSGIWGEKKSINGGFPYLLANPPPK